MEKYGKIKYKDEQPKYINGAFGGTTPKGELIVNFYTETTPQPKMSKIIFDDDIGAEEVFVDEDSEIIIERFVETSLIMNMTTAKAVYEWLGRNIPAEAKEGD